MYRALFNTQERATESCDQFEALSRHVDQDLILEWSGLSTEPRLEDGEWVSVYRHPQGSRTSSDNYHMHFLTLLTVPNQASVYRHMLSEELRAQASELHLACPMAQFVNNGIKIQAQQ